ncbi:hypothetical protein STEG23_019229, partial [Scotinomys teguina]
MEVDEGVWKTFKNAIENVDSKDCTPEVRGENKDFIVNDLTDEDKDFIVLGMESIYFIFCPGNLSSIKNAWRPYVNILDGVENGEKVWNWSHKNMSATDENDVVERGKGNEDSDNDNDGGFDDSNNDDDVRGDANNDVNGDANDDDNNGGGYIDKVAASEDNNDDGDADDNYD